MPPLLHWLLTSTLPLGVTLRQACAVHSFAQQTGQLCAAYRPQFEGSAALLLNRNVAVGAEVRTKPDNLRFAHEGTAFDVFGAYFLNKNASATLAFVALGPVARQGSQSGVYLSLQGGF